MSANNRNIELFNPIGKTPALVEAIKIGIPKEYHEKIRLGGYIALESIKTTPGNVQRCYSNLELLHEPKNYNVDYSTRLKVTRDQLNMDLVAPESKYRPLDELFSNIEKGEPSKEKIRWKDLNKNSEG